MVDPVTFPFKVGDRVVYSNRAQQTPYMLVEEIDETLFCTRMKVDGRWWSGPSAFEPWVPELRLVR